VEDNSLYRRDDNTLAASRGRSLAVGDAVIPDQIESSLFVKQFFGSSARSSGGRGDVRASWQS